ncbi:hypothetical protein BD410DRAFT_649764 [Rickenella mellea]|uniref:Uncharacterized protein n=1 Tax=Rickenella mellea TaxID=50990 RepID=A0A4Y7PM09_9AGAM|nr:hypothetical protein BD410DRAFT_649764 [Rickenella mellea]
MKIPDLTRRRRRFRFGLSLCQVMCLERIGSARGAVTQIHNHMAMDSRTWRIPHRNCFASSLRLRRFGFASRKSFSRTTRAPKIQEAYAKFREYSCGVCYLFITCNTRCVRTLHVMEMHTSEGLEG